MTKLYLDYGFFKEDGDPGLSISTTQKLLFPPEFIGSNLQIPATIGLEIPIDGSYFYNVLLGSSDTSGLNLTTLHPWNVGYWLLGVSIVSRIPETGERFGWSGSGNDVEFFYTQHFWTNFNNTKEL